MLIAQTEYNGDDGSTLSAARLKTYIAAIEAVTNNEYSRNTSGPKYRPRAIDTSGKYQ